MQFKDLKRLRVWFDTYVDGHFTHHESYDHDVRLKLDHTRRVCKHIRKLGRTLGLRNNQLMLAETMALYHDIGRFEQYRVYRTFNDRMSKNHAHWSVRIVAQNHLLYSLPKTERILIYNAIAYHNRARLPETDDKERLFYMRLLRDADKLDIWRVILSYYRKRKKKPNTTIELGLPDLPVYAQPVLQALQQGRIARMSDMTTLHDFQLLQISWIYDLNFLPAFEVLQKQRYLEKLAAFLPADEQIDEAMSQVFRYVDDVLNGTIATADGLL